MLESHQPQGLQKLAVVLETWVDKCIPAVEVSGTSRSSFSDQEFERVMAYFLEEWGFRLRWAGEEACVMEFQGQMVAGSRPLTAIFGTPKAEMYDHLKSRFRCVLGNGGRIRVTVFEHVVSFEKERNALREQLKDRLDHFLEEMKGPVGNDR